MDAEQVRKEAARYVREWPSSNEDEWRRAANVREIVDVELFVKTAAYVQNFNNSASAAKLRSDADRIWKE